MNIDRITFKRTKNLGNYESETCEMSASLDENENVNEAITKLKFSVNRALQNAQDEISCENLPF